MSADSFDELSHLAEWWDETGRGEYFFKMNNEREIHKESIDELTNEFDNATEERKKEIQEQGLRLNYNIGYWWRSDTDNVLTQTDALIQSQLSLCDKLASFPSVPLSIFLSKFLRASNDYINPILTDPKAVIKGSKEPPTLMNYYYELLMCHMLVEEEKESSRLKDASEEEKEDNRTNYKG
jgi:hypothetical protein